MTNRRFGPRLLSNMYLLNDNRLRQCTHVVAYRGLSIETISTGKEMENEEEESERSDGVCHGIGLRLHGRVRVAGFC